MIEVLNCVLNEDLALLYDLERNRADGWSLSMLTNSLSDPNTYFLKAVYNNKAVGYICYSVLFDEAEINSIFVLEDFRRMRIGTKLINKVVELAAKMEVKRIFLEVNENNQAAIFLYKNLEFKEISVRKNYYGSDTALIFRRTLSS